MVECAVLEDVVTVVVSEVSVVVVDAVVEGVVLEDVVTVVVESVVVGAF